LYAIAIAIRIPKEHAPVFGFGLEIRDLPHAHQLPLKRGTILNGSFFAKIGE
jgi:hypothetical protein